jgi:hypothetical protein
MRLKQVSFQVRATDPTNAEDFNGWNVLCEVTVNKSIMDSMATEVFDGTVKLLIERNEKKGRKRMDYTLYYADCDVLVSSCKSYTKLMSIIKKQHPNLDFTKFDGYQTNIGIFEYLSENYSMNIKDKIQAERKKVK